ncbi:GNAT family N-acetyltransferase [Streptacidiphilus monticola]|jgi:GNAT superfamily N-acetyltransferase|uniref:GNAT family N-acetyltransferase n=1 Tax=Streptacidiphilus monticola TaxID=2161674 RepID=A0ABW1GA46_9ACTN
MALQFALDPELTPRLLDEVVALWTDVTNAGGAVGFVAPVTPERVRPVAEKAFAGVREGRDRFLAARDTEDGSLAAILFIEDQRFNLFDHWRMLKRVMVHPRLQGRGYGLDLLREAERVARTMGLEALQLSARGGLGLESFYTRAGYKEVGRVPAAIRVAPGDDRDSIFFWLDLREDLR